MILVVLLRCLGFRFPITSKDKKYEEQQGKLMLTVQSPKSKNENRTPGLRNPGRTSSTYNIYLGDKEKANLKLLKRPVQRSLNSADAAWMPEQSNPWEHWLWVGRSRWQS